MKLIYSNVPPLKIDKDAYTLSEYVNEKMAESDSLYCAVGYASQKSLIELEDLVKKYNLKNVVLVMGMYCVEGFPEGIYNTAMKINQTWQDDGIGDVRATKSMKYHGKVYGFYKSGNITAAIVGSHNLGALTTDANNLRQYELSVSTDVPEECKEIDDHLKKVVVEPVSTPIDEISGITIIHEDNTKLNDVEGVVKVSMDDVETYKQAETSIMFEIPLKVPGIPGSSKDFMKSNINKCYAKGRLNTKTGVVTERGWWETEIIVSSTTTQKPNYPERDVPFYVITDDGYKFKMHVSGDYSKNFESDGDLKILGYWLKGRLVAAGIVEPVDSPSADLENVKSGIRDIYRDCKGVITYQKLRSYGRTSVTLTKTLNKLADENGIMRDVWVLSFLPKDVK